MVEVARLESVFRVKPNGGSNPPLSAKYTQVVDSTRNPLFMRVRSRSLDYFTVYIRIKYPNGKEEDGLPFWHACP